PMSKLQYLKWTLLGFLACFICYIPLYPVGLFLKENVFSWLPEWYFDPGFGTDNIALVAKAFLFAIFIDGLVGPIAEELFFRGYLLPRMSFLKNWAPILNGVLFGLYHFWQPHNLIAISIVGVIISWIVWKKKNVYLGIFIHCTLNIIGALSGYLAATGGVIIPR
ncbi:MAG: CPBP family intramembrane glutamic endopeptidase, partial [Bacteroidota bacterium]